MQTLIPCPRLTSGTDSAYFALNDARRSKGLFSTIGHRLVCAIEDHLTSLVFCPSLRNGARDFGDRCDPPAIVTLLEDNGQLFDHVPVIRFNVFQKLWPMETH